MKSEKVLLGVLAGIAIGAVAGILLAPDKGSNTRAKIMDDTKDFTDELSQKIKDEVDALRNKASELEQMLQEKMNKQL